MTAPIVFFDIAGPDVGALREFYASNFGWSINDHLAVDTGALKGTLRRDPAGKIIYFGVPDIDAALAAVNASGGNTEMPRTVIPNVATFALFSDPTGNRMGLVETKANLG